jgi:hypothetical protein
MAQAIAQLMYDCWAYDPRERPDFRTIARTIEQVIGALPSLPRSRLSFSLARARARVYALSRVRSRLGRLEPGQLLHRAKHGRARFVHAPEAPRRQAHTAPKILHGLVSRPRVRLQANVQINNK